MDWRLLEYADEAEETAKRLLAFEGEIPQYRKNIRAHIAELYAISHALHELHDDLELSRYGRNAGYILKDLKVCLSSLDITLADVQDIFGKSKRNRHSAPGAFPGTPPYAIIWEDALADFETQGMTLPRRFEAVREYLQFMHDALKGHEDEGQLAKFKVMLSKLLKKQKPIDSYSNKPAGQGSGKGSAKTPKPSSPNVPRPKIRSHPTYPATQYVYQAPLPSPVPQRAHTPQRAHIAPTWGGIGIGDIPYIPPPVPEIPISPTSSAASSHAYSAQSTDSEPVAHWAMKIFDGRHTTTPFHTFGEPTECFGPEEPNVIQMLEADGFQRVVELPFEAASVFVRIYWRPHDERARMIFLTKDASGQRMRHQMLLTSLVLRRSDSCLKLCTKNHRDGGLDLWARLRFTLYERMVLFYCTTVAMKRQDQKGVAEGLDDVFNPGNGEEIIFSGETVDHKYKHAFRVYYDPDSGCVRFEATARRGPMKSIPIWTAFVTQYIGRRDWMKRTSPETIEFQKLHPYVFCDSYKVPKSSKGGKYQLTFTLAEDAKYFKDVFHHIGVS
ncbi:hypothetical protein CFE70_009983 [Pyrenophora teres f. teres 0-1]|uniref:Uncharacterized protein n=1 Tax=Pyrenophora teres f. teres (strain 0-1) TaxID=861557 RepID=E3SA23_PYRTT|nr:hypothetical protein PTT_19936 [Pyrenophora teres f. teres 0-1]KAE8826805.1 hypothetical protein HRS9139_07977 [Pyrenophora teres f. teres]KAE8860364.1 hypothetical protein PTNB73_07974 [Pyrenophora teres f. teres]